MKQGTTELGKFRKLVRRLRPLLKSESAVDAATVAVGLNERLWTATAANARDGAIGRLDNETLAELVGWLGDPDALIEAWVDTRWLNRHEDHRLVVNDWPDHCPRFVVAAVKRDYLAGRGGWADRDVPEEWLQERLQKQQQKRLQTEHEKPPETAQQESQKSALPSQVESSQVESSPALPRAGSNRSDSTRCEVDVDLPVTVPPPDPAEAYRFGRSIGKAPDRRDKLLAWQLVALKPVLGEAWLANVAEAVRTTQPQNPWAYARRVAAEGSRERPGPGAERLAALLSRVEKPPDDWPASEEALREPTSDPVAAA